MYSLLEYVDWSRGKLCVRVESDANVTNSSISKGRQTCSHEHVFGIEYSMTHLLALLDIITG